MVHTAHRMLTDRITTQAMTPAQKRSRTIQMRDRNIPAASPAVSLQSGMYCTQRFIHLIMALSHEDCHLSREKLMVRGGAWAL